jgi:hypothetical protein
VAGASHPSEDRGAYDLVATADEPVTTDAAR